jgi:hypothetical protein
MFSGIVGFFLILSFEFMYQRKKAIQKLQEQAENEVSAFAT